MCTSAIRLITIRACKTSEEAALHWPATGPQLPDMQRPWRRPALAYLLLECPLQQHLQNQLKSSCQYNQKDYNLKNIFNMQRFVDEIFAFIKNTGKVL